MSIAAASLLVFAPAGGRGAAAAQSLPGGVVAYDTALSRDAEAAVARAQEGLSASVVGRRLLAETTDVARREAPTGLPVSYRRSPPALLFDMKAARAASERDFELALARELRRAQLAFPLAAPEEEQACRQDELAFALERASADKNFAFALCKPPARSELESVAREAALFAEDPDRFYLQVESGLPEEVRQAALPLVSDFLKAHEGRLPSAPKGADYVAVDGQRYPAALVRAALVLGRENGLARAREALDDFDGKAAHELRKQAKRWLGRR